MVIQSTGHMWHGTIASFLSRKISETERLCSDDIVSRLKGLVITSLTPFWWRNVINSLSDSDINLDTAMFSEGYAPVKVNPPPPNPGHVGELRGLKLIFTWLWSPCRPEERTNSRSSPTRPESKRGLHYPLISGFFFAPHGNYYFAYITFFLCVSIESPLVTTFLQ